MNGEERSDKGTGPLGGSHLAQHKKQENGGRAVQQDARQVMAAGIETVELAIQDMRKRGERVPVILVLVGKRPANRSRGQATFDHRILVHVGVVIEVDELVLERLAKNDPDQGGKEKTNAQDSPPVA